MFFPVFFFLFGEGDSGRKQSAAAAVFNVFFHGGWGEVDAENVLSLWEEADTRSPECQNGDGKEIGVMLIERKLNRLLRCRCCVNYMQIQVRIYVLFLLNRFVILCDVMYMNL